MPQIDPQLSTGLPGLDRLITGLIPGDNVVWQVAGLDDYGPFVDPYAAHAVAAGGLVYFRFAKHPPLVPAGPGVRIIELQPEAGFEAFVSDIHDTIEAAGQGGYYLFDMLSELAVDWYSDQMLGNFFMLTCPYLYDVGAVAYFGLRQGYHSREATGAIANTAQILLHVYRHRERLYVHPNKVDQRYAPTMYMLHVRDGDDFRPVTQSATVSEIMNSVSWSQLEEDDARLGVVNRAFLEAEESFENGRAGERGARELLLRLLRTCMSRDERVHGLLAAHLSLPDVLAVRRRMIGTGLIGGKSVGMLLARAILVNRDERWRRRLEPHDSFYVGADVYYTFVVRNGLWWIRERQRDPGCFLDGAEQARQRMLFGTFPEYVIRQFGRMLDYYGQSPIIVRSSSLLEDNFGNAFAGKYESVFCPNQGPRHQRIEEFLNAVRTIFASTMSEQALAYRAQRGLLEHDEQMALLIQRVSGGLYGGWFYPQVAGVALSYNPYVWSEDIEPEAGMLRLVFGLGTRAVDRADDDYTRVVALNQPTRRPEASIDDRQRYSQRRVDLIDLAGNRQTSTDFAAAIDGAGDLPLEVFASRETNRRAGARRRPSSERPWLLTFDRLLAETGFAGDMRAMLAVLQEAYAYPVDVEFTANFTAPDEYRINLVQCRPLQIQGGGEIVEPPSVDDADLVLRTRGAVIGQSRIVPVDRVIEVVPAVYGQLPIQKRHAVARLIGKLNQRADGDGTVLLVGPGRWGTTSASLGVPVNFAEINRVSVICEVVAMREGLVPDVSLGTHFFNELVEMEMLYLALFPGKEGNLLNEERLAAVPNRLTELLPAEAGMAEIVRVIDADDLAAGRRLLLNANALSQKVVCYTEAEPA